MWLPLIIGHAGAATLAFAVGVAALVARDSRQRRRRAGWFVVALMMMTGLLVAAIVSHWNDLAAVEQIVFPVLAGLAGVMCVHGRRAHLIAANTESRISNAFVDAIGFGLIALSEGLVIVGAIDLGAPLLVVVVLAVAVLLIGRRLITRAAHR